MSIQNSTSTTGRTYLNIDELIFAGLALIGVFTSLINILVFVRLRLKDNVYKYYLVSSVVDFLYMLIISFYALIACGTPCDQMNGFSIAKMIYKIVLDDYLTSCLAIYNIIMEVFITVQRYFLISKRKTLQNYKPLRVMLAISIVSLVFYSPVLCLKKIVFSDKYGYQTVYTKFGHSETGRIIPIFLSTIRLFIGSFILLIVNLFTVIRFKEYLKEKNLIKVSEFSSNINLEGRHNWSPKEKVENRAKKNVTQMVILIAFNYSFGTIPYALYYGLHELFQTSNNFIDNTLCMIGNAGLRLLIILKIFIFFKYNKVYRQNFKIYRGRLTKRCSFNADHKLCAKL